MEISDEYLAHYGIRRRSGRYPWGSGGTEVGAGDFLSEVKRLGKEEGLTRTQIARGMGITTTELRARVSIASNYERQQKINSVVRLKDKGLSDSEIGRRMGINESSVRSALKDSVQDRVNIIESTANVLRDQVEQHGYIDVGAQVERHLGCSTTQFKTAVATLKEEGYVTHPLKVKQLGTGEYTNFRVLAKPGTTQRMVWENQDKVRIPTAFSEDGGRSYLGLHDPLSISSKRVGINWREDGGDKLDGVMYVRPGVKDVSLGASPYAQVRVMVDGTHYLKGMAIYKDDLPAGTDIVFNTNKSRSNKKHDAFKEIKLDEDNPFGAVVRQQVEKDAKTGLERVTSAMNKVGLKPGQYEEGGWDDWSRNLPSQFLSKQSPDLAKHQLDMTLERRKNEFAEIKSLTNPSVRQKLLQTFGDSTDSAAVHLQAANIPGQATKVLLPVPTLKDHEIYAPSFPSGTRVSLVRFPHGGTFEIPELTVNNNHPEAKKLLRNARDAVGINHKVAERLSGADFDGDTALVIPNNRRDIKSTPPLEKLKGFDPKHSFPPYDGMRTIDGGVYDAKADKVNYPKDSEGRDKKTSYKQTEMGIISNLITDMTLQGASEDELARAVRHSMVVIDAEKHVLDYKSSRRDNGIPALHERYQGSKRGGAKTLISQATAQERVFKRKARPAKLGGPIDPVTGEKRVVETGQTHVNRKGERVRSTFESKRLAETSDAHTLVSDANTRIERIYADHSNRLKAMANDARKELVHTKPRPIEPSAKRVFADQVKSLDAQLAIAERNAPLERQAQILANATVNRKRRDNPGMDKEQRKKVERQALAEARRRTGADKTKVNISEAEWQAIQAGAISKSKLDRILTHGDIDQIKELATPRTRKLMTSTSLSRARQMLSQGYTDAEVAEALGVSVSTLRDGLKE